MSPRRSKALETLAALEATLADERARLARIGHEERIAEGAVATTREALIEAIASDKPERTPRKALEAAEARVKEPWSERKAAAGRRVTEAQGALSRFVGDNMAAISAEMRPGAEEAKAELERSLAAVIERIGDWQAFDSRWTVILQAAGAAESRPMPRLGLEGVRSEVRAALEGSIPEPMPRRDRLAEAIG